MSDLDILHEIEKEYDIKFEEISEEDWEKYVNSQRKFRYLKNEYYVEDENIILVSLDNIDSIPNQIWRLKLLRELYLSSIEFETFSSEIESLTRLKVLSIHYNEELKNFPEQLIKLETLEELSLDYNNETVKLPESIWQLRSLKKLAISEFHRITSLPPEISNLVNLEELSIDESPLINLPSEIGNLKKLRKLDFTPYDIIESIPSSICELTNLSELYIGKIKELPSKIGKLKNLKKLTVGRNSKSNYPKFLPKEIGELSNLEVLHVKGTGIESLPDEIGSLESLQEFTIISNKNLKELPNSIGRLISLKKLKIGLSDHRFNSEVIQPLKIIPRELGNLNLLEELNIENTLIETLPNDIGKLYNLKKLSIISNNNLTSLPIEIGKLKNLKELIIKENDVRRLPQEIGDLEDIEELDLSNNIRVNFEDIPQILSKLENSKLWYLNLSGYTYLNNIPKEITSLNNLKTLDVSDCNIATLNLKWEKCVSLQKLYLSNNKISDLEPLKDLKSIEKIDLSGNKDLTSIPESFLQIPSLQSIIIDYLQNQKLMEKINKDKENLLSGVREYYRKKRETLSQIQKQVKVILIGDGNSGKTSLLRRLLLDGFSDNSATTHGIRLEEDYFEIDNDKVKIKYWDMGGQDVYHSPHSFFFSDNTIYLLVLDARKEEAPEYWMEQIRTYGNSVDTKRKSPVLVVVNKIDAYPSHEIDISRLEEKIELIGGQVFEVSAFENKGIKEVEKALHGFIEAQLKDNTRLINKTGEQYKDLTRDIYNLRYDTIFKDREYLNQNEFNEFLTKNKLQNQKDVLVKELQELGAILSFPHPKIQNPLYVYKPEWLIDKIYHLFKVAKNEKAGMIDILDLPKILDCKESQEIKFIQSIIEKVFELAFTKTINGESFLFIPDALPYKKENATNTDRDNTILIQVKFPYLNRRIISNCMIEFSKKLSEQKIWKTGMVLKIREEEISMEALEEERMVSFYIPNSIAKDGLVFIQNSLTAIEGDNLNFPKTSLYVQVPPFIIKDFSLEMIECMIDIEEAKFYWNQTEEIRNLYFPTHGIKKPIPLDEVLKFYGIEIHEKKKINASPTIIINANENVLTSIEDLLENGSDDSIVMSQRISAKLKESAGDSYNESKEKLKYWIPDYIKVTEFSREALVDAFYLYEMIEKLRKSNYTAVVFQLARAFEQEITNHIFLDFQEYCKQYNSIPKEPIVLENYILNDSKYKSIFMNYFSDIKENVPIDIATNKIGTFKGNLNSLDTNLDSIVYTLACSHLMKDEGNLFVRYFKKFLNEKFHFERIGTNEFAASLIELKELRNKAAHKGTHFNEEQGKLVWKKMTYFFQDWTRALKG
jgi:hypothetical protein